MSGQEADRFAEIEPQATAKAMSVVTEVYGRQMEACATVEQAQQLATDLVNAAHPTESPATQYALILSAARVLADAGDLTAAFRQVAELQRRFTVNEFQLYSDLLSHTFEHSRRNDAAATIVDALIRDVETRILEGQYEQTVLIARAAVDASASLKSKAAREPLRELLVRAQDWHNRFTAADLAWQTLQQLPQDPRANFTLGSWRCFAQGDWAGLAMLAQGSEAHFRELARQDLAGTFDPWRQLQIGDQWWDISQEAEEPFAAQQRHRAAHWYRLALHGLPLGIERQKVLARLDEFQGSVPRQTSAPVASTAGELPKQLTSHTEPSTQESESAGSVSRTEKRKKRSINVGITGMIGRYKYNDTVIPFVNLSIPNGSNVFSDSIAQRFGTHFDATRFSYVGVGWIDVPSTGTYRLTAGRATTVRIDNQEVDLSNYGQKNSAELKLSTGLHQVQLEAINNGGQLNEVLVEIHDSASNLVPIFITSRDAEETLTTPVQNIVPQEISGWQSRPVK